MPSTPSLRSSRSRPAPAAPGQELAREPPGGITTEPPTTSNGGNPYSFYGSVAECAFAQRTRCESCMPVGNCTRRAPNPKPPELAACELLLAGNAPSSSSNSLAGSAGERPALPDSPTYRGFHIPAWAVRLAPQPGENLLAFRDRMMPLAKAAVEPHRVRVARGRDDFATAANLDSRQRAELDAAVQDAATQIQDRVFNAVLGGDFAPSTFKPMTGVTLARDVLDTVDQANKRFLGTLREDQRARLSPHPFDLADYLVFSTKWEDALGF